VWVTSGGAKTFMLYRKVNGRPERMKIGPIADWSIDSARDEAEKLVARINEGKNPQAEKRRLRGQPTLRQLFAKYLEDHAKLHARRWKDLEHDFQRYLATIENRRLIEIEKSDVAHLHAALGRDRGRYAANRAVEILRAVVNWGLKNHIIDSQMLSRGQNPATGIHAFDEIKRDRFVRANELPKFFRALADEPSSDMHDFVMLSLLTGARRSNVLSMRWGDLDPDQAIWRVPDTKNKEPLNLPLMPDAVAILRQRAQSQKDEDGHPTSNYVFPGPGAKGHMVSPKKGWRRVLDRARLYDLLELVGQREGWDGGRIEAERNEARKTGRKALAEYVALAQELGIDTEVVGLPDLRLHDLRRTLGSWQAATGASLHIIGKSLGHRDAKSTEIYARLDLDPVRQAMRAATEAMMLAGRLKQAAGKAEQHTKKRKFSGRRD